MRKTITLAITAATCAFVAYAFWNADSEIDNDAHEHHHSHEHSHHHDHHHHDHDDIVSITPEQLQSQGIEIRKAHSGQLQHTIQTPAKVILCADRMAHVFPKVTGTVVDVYKNLGQFVDKNEILATIGSREMAEAKAEYLAAYNRNQLMEGNFQREKTLYEKKISASQEFYRSENAKEEAVIELTLAAQKLHALGLSEEEISQLTQAEPHSLRVYEMRSPIAGKVIARHATPGELISMDHEAFAVANLDKLWIEISIFPQDRKHVKEGQALTIFAHDGKKAEASVVYLSPIIDEETRVSTAIAEIDNRSGKWFPGTFVNAELITAISHASLVVPKEAIQNIEGADVVFTPTEEGFSLRPIKIGKSDANQCEIVEGLAPGEAYACKNTFLLKAHLQKDEAEHSH